MKSMYVNFLNAEYAPGKFIRKVLSCTSTLPVDYNPFNTRSVQIELPKEVEIGEEVFVIFPLTQTDDIRVMFTKSSAKKQAKELGIPVIGYKTIVLLKLEI